MKIAEVVLSHLPIEKTFHYAIPQELLEGMRPGVRVEVPLGNRRLSGFVVSIQEESPVQNIKEILKLLDPKANALTEEFLALSQFLSRQTLCSLGEALGILFPKKAIEGIGPAPEIPTDVCLDLPVHPELSKLLSQDPGGVLLWGPGKILKEQILACAAKTLSQDKGVIWIFPEIQSAEAVYQEIRRQFPGNILGLWHAKKSLSERARLWRLCHEGSVRFLLGTRSAALAPMRRLGLMAVSDEEFFSHREDQKPYYHSREVARFRAQAAGAFWFLASPSPSLEAKRWARENVLKTLQISEPSQARVTLVDLRSQRGPITDTLRRRLEESLLKGQKSILIVNKRGYAHPLCEACGFTMRCVSCQRNLVYHTQKKLCLCHLCGFHQELPGLCPSCRRAPLILRGHGTERILKQMRQLFPLAEISHLDKDTGQGAQALLKDFTEGRIQILVATTFLFHRADAPTAAVVAFLQADPASLHSDYRSNEVAFALYQRAREISREELILQVYNPEDAAIEAFLHETPEALFSLEENLRTELMLPPFGEVARVGLVAKREKTALGHLEELSKTLAAMDPRLILLGPAIEERKSRRGVSAKLILKGKIIPPVIRQALRQFQEAHAGKARIHLNPLTLE